MAGLALILLILRLRDRRLIQKYLCYGLLAVLLAYILPAVVILATFALLFSLHLSELWVALITLVAVALYGGILYLCRNRLQQKFTFRLAKRG